MSKNRNGKPTEFQKKTLKNLGFKGTVKTYRDAENAIKRLRNASKKTATKAKTPVKQPCKDKCQCHAKPSRPGSHCSKKTALVKKDAADRLPTIKDGYCVQRITIPNNIKVQAQIYSLVKQMNDFFASVNSTFFG